MQTTRLSIVIPAHNECPGLTDLLPALRQSFPDAEIILSDDGSTDGSDALAGEPGMRRVVSPYCAGNGAAVKRGVRAASGDVILLMDGDGQHQAKDAERLVRRFFEDGYDMVVGARRGRSQASIGRSLANRIYSALASWMTGRRIPDLTSGMRVVDADKLREFLHLLPNGFSYPTTVTMAFFRSGFSVGYEPIEALPRKGNSHIRPVRDGVRFLVIIFKIGSLYSPLKLFLPISLLAFLGGVGLYVYTFLTAGRFTNMSVLLLSTSLLVFLIGLVSEQITSLMFSRRGG
ncbi:MAG: glycosyltransferase family 2 protein [Chromatiales bacterium]|jgi:glycosyltransferase involved in cell wall biosynthesis